MSRHIVSRVSCITPAYNHNRIEISPGIYRLTDVWHVAIWFDSFRFSQGQGGVETIGKAVQDSGGWPQSAADLFLVCLTTKNEQPILHRAVAPPPPRTRS